MQLLRGRQVSGLRTARQQLHKPCVGSLHTQRRRVPGIRAEFVKNDPPKSSPALAPVREETTVPTALRPIPTVEVKEKAAPSTPPQDALADIQHLKELIDTASKAQEVYAKYTQEQVDAIFKAAAAAASAARINLAVM